MVRCCGGRFGHFPRMKKLIAVIALIAGLSPAIAQQFPTVQDHSVIGRIGTGSGSGPSQAIPFATLLSQMAAVPTSRNINTTAPLSGGGNLSADRTLSITANGIDNTLIRQSTALSLIGRSANSTGNVADISAVANSSCVFLENASSLSCGQVATAGIANNAVTNAKLAQAAASTLKGNATAGAANETDFTITGLTSKASPVSGDEILISDSAASNVFKKTTLGAIASLASTPSYIGFITGLQPLKLGGGVIGLNPGAWANNTGTATFNSGSNVLTVDLTTAVPNFASYPAGGAQVSGALSVTSNATDGTEVFLYLIHRNSDNRPLLVGSSADTQGPNNVTFTATATTPGVITTASNHGLRKRMMVTVSNSGGALPSPLGAGTAYYVCTVPALNQITLATSIANVNSGSCLTFSTTGTGTNTVSWGVQMELNFQLGAGVATFDRRVPYFAFVWSWTKYGSSGVPGGTNGIPDFQVAQGASDTLLTGAGGSSSFQALSGGTAGSFTTVDLSPWLANLNRRVLLFTSCVYPSSAGGCFIRAPGSGGAGIQVGAPSSATIPSTGMWTFQTDSTTKIEYQVTGGANLTIYVMGWTFVDPS